MRAFLATTLILLLTPSPVMAQTAPECDLDAGARFGETALQARAALDSADTQGAREESLEEIAEAYSALVGWQTAFFEAGCDEPLDSETRSAMYNAYERYGEDLVAYLLELERCESVVSWADTLLASGLRNDDVREAVVVAPVRAQECLEGPSPVQVTVECSPANARVHLADGTGLACGETVAVGPGAIRATVTAPGFESELLAVDEAQPGDRVVLGPVALEPTVEPQLPAHRPGALEWTLWGFSVASAATSIGLFVSATRLEHDIEDADAAGLAVRNRQEEFDRIDRMRFAGALTGGLALGAAVTGILTFVLSDDTESDTVTLGVGATGVTLWGTF